jgi:hypothetical protein
VSGGADGEVLAEIFLCDACSYQEIEVDTEHAAAGGQVCAPLRSPLDWFFPSVVESTFNFSVAAGVETHSCACPALPRRASFVPGYDDANDDDDDDANDDDDDDVDDDDDDDDDVDDDDDDDANDDDDVDDDDDDDADDDDDDDDDVDDGDDEGEEDIISSRASGCMWPHGGRR